MIQKQPEPQDERAETPPDNEERAMEQAQEEAAEERENERGYQ